LHPEWTWPFHAYMYMPYISDHPWDTEALSRRSSIVGNAAYATPLPGWLSVGWRRIRHNRFGFLQTIGLLQKSACMNYYISRRPPAVSPSEVLCRSASSFCYPRTPGPPAPDQAKVDQGADGRVGEMDIPRTAFEPDLVRLGSSCRTGRMSCGIMCFCFPHHKANKRHTSVAIGSLSPTHGHSELYVPHLNILRSRILPRD
jgi:hypothetical protein